MGVRGASMGVRGAPMGVRGAPMGVRGAPMGVLGESFGIFGADSGILGREMGERGASFGARALPEHRRAGQEALQLRNADAAFLAERDHYSVAGPPRLKADLAPWDCTGCDFVCIKNLRSTSFIGLADLNGL